MYPSTMEEIVAAPPGTPVYDSHYHGPGTTLPRFISEYYPDRVAVTPSIIATILAPIVHTPVNKIAYKVESNDVITVLAYTYDHVGWILTIEH